MQVCVLRGLETVPRKWERQILRLCDALIEMEMQPQSTKEQRSASLIGFGVVKLLAAVQSFAFCCDEVSLVNFFVTLATPLNKISPQTVTHSFFLPICILDGNDRH